MLGFREACRSFLRDIICNVALSMIRAEIEDSSRACVRNLFETNFHDWELCCCSRIAKFPGGSIAGHNFTSKAVLVVECFQQADEMCCGRQHHEDMKDLVRASPNIESTGSPSLWYSSLFDGH